MKASFTLAAFKLTLISFALAAALPSQRSRSLSCDDFVAGLTAWSDSDFAGSSHQYNVSWNTCSMFFSSASQDMASHHERVGMSLTAPTVSIAGQFPYKASPGVSSIAANAYNWCTVYP